jgi:integrase
MALFSFGSGLLTTMVRDSARTAQSILGHADVPMILNVYTQVVEESQRSAVEKIAAVLDPDGPSLARNQAAKNTTVH